MLGLFAVAGLGTVFNNASMNLTKSYGNSSQIATQQASHDKSAALFGGFAGGTALSLFLYIGLTVCTFTMKNSKRLGIVFIVIGAIPIFVTIGWGIVPFALFLPAGIVALRKKKSEEVKA